MWQAGLGRGVWARAPCAEHAHFGFTGGTAGRTPLPSLPGGSAFNFMPGGSFPLLVLYTH